MKRSKLVQLLKKRLTRFNQPQKNDNQTDTQGYDYSNDEITLAGEKGDRIARDILHINCGILAVEDASPEISQDKEGRLVIQVSPRTLQILRTGVDPVAAN